MLIDERLTQRIIGAAMEVHRHLGPGLLESAYEECLCHELELIGLSFQRQAECSKPFSVSSVPPW
jgi:GxxExxY protein